MPLPPRQRMRIIEQHLSSPSGGRGATTYRAYPTSSCPTAGASRGALALEQHEDLSVSEGSAAAAPAKPVDRQGDDDFEVSEEEADDPNDEAFGEKPKAKPRKRRRKKKKKAAKKTANSFTWDPAGAKQQGEMVWIWKLARIVCTTRRLTRRRNRKRLLSWEQTGWAFST